MYITVCLFSTAIELHAVAHFTRFFYFDFSEPSFLNATLFQFNRYYCASSCAVVSQLNDLIAKAPSNLLLVPQPVLFSCLNFNIIRII